MSLNHIIDMAAKITESLNVDIDNDTMVLPQSIYYDNLPAGVTPEIADAVNSYNVEFVACTGLIAGQQAQAYFNDNPEAETLQLVAPLAHADVDHMVYRNYQINEETHPMYLVSGYSVNTRGCSEDIVRSVIDQVAALPLNAVEVEETMEA